MEVIMLTIKLSYREIISNKKELFKIQRELHQLINHNKKSPLVRIAKMIDDILRGKEVIIKEEDLLRSSLLRKVVFSFAGQNKQQKKQQKQLNRKQQRQQRKQRKQQRKQQRQQQRKQQRQQQHQERQQQQQQKKQQRQQKIQRKQYLASLEKKASRIVLEKLYFVDSLPTINIKKIKNIKNNNNIEMIEIYHEIKKEHKKLKFRANINHRLMPRFEQVSNWLAAYKDALKERQEILKNNNLLDFSERKQMEKENKEAVSSFLKISSKNQDRLDAGALPVVFTEGKMEEVQVDTSGKVSMLEKLGTKAARPLGLYTLGKGLPADAIHETYLTLAEKGYGMDDVRDAKGRSISKHLNAVFPIASMLFSSPVFSQYCFRAEKNNVSLEDTVRAEASLPSLFVNNTVTLSGKNVIVADLGNASSINELVEDGYVVGNPGTVLQISNHDVGELDGSFFVAPDVAKALGVDENRSAQFRVVSRLSVAEIERLEDLDQQWQALIGTEEVSIDKATNIIGRKVLELIEEDPGFRPVRYGKGLGMVLKDTIKPGTVILDINSIKGSSKSYIKSYVKRHGYYINRMPVVLGFLQDYGKGFLKLSGQGMKYMLPSLPKDFPGSEGKSVSPMESAQRRFHMFVLEAIKAFEKGNGSKIADLLNKDAMAESKDKKVSIVDSVLWNHPETRKEVIAYLQSFLRNNQYGFMTEAMKQLSDHHKEAYHLGLRDYGMDFDTNSNNDKYYQEIDIAFNELKTDDQKKIKALYKEIKDARKASKISIEKLYNETIEIKIDGTFKQVTRKELVDLMSEAHKAKDYELLNSLKVVNDSWVKSNIEEIKQIKKEVKNIVIELKDKIEDIEYNYYSVNDNEKNVINDYARPFKVENYDGSVDDLYKVVYKNDKFWAAFPEVDGVIGFMFRHPVSEGFVLNRCLLVPPTPHQNKILSEGFWFPSTVIKNYLVGDTDGDTFGVFPLDLNIKVNGYNIDVDYSKEDYKIYFAINKKSVEYPKTLHIEEILASNKVGANPKPNHIGMAASLSSLSAQLVGPTALLQQFTYRVISEIKIQNKDKNDFIGFRENFLDSNYAVQGVMLELGINIKKKDVLDILDSTLETSVDFAPEAAKYLYCALPGQKKVQKETGKFIVNWAYYIACLQGLPMSSLGIDVDDIKNKEVKAYFGYMSNKVKFQDEFSPKWTVNVFRLIKDYTDLLGLDIEMIHGQARPIDSYKIINPNTVKTKEQYKLYGITKNAGFHDGIWNMLSFSNKALSYAKKHIEKWLLNVNPNIASRVWNKAVAGFQWSFLSEPFYQLKKKEKAPAWQDNAESILQEAYITKQLELGLKPSLKVNKEGKGSYRKFKDYTFFYNTISTANPIDHMIIGHVLNNNLDKVALEEIARLYWDNEQFSVYLDKKIEKNEDLYAFNSKIDEKLKDLHVIPQGSKLEWLLNKLGKIDYFYKQFQLVVIEVALHVYFNVEFKPNYGSNLVKFFLGFFYEKGENNDSINLNWETAVFVADRYKEAGVYISNKKTLGNSSNEILNGLPKGIKTTLFHLGNTAIDLQWFFRVNFPEERWLWNDFYQVDEHNNSTVTKDYFISSWGRDAVKELGITDFNSNSSRSRIAIKILVPSGTTELKWDNVKPLYTTLKVNEKTLKLDKNGVDKKFHSVVLFDGDKAVGIISHEPIVGRILLGYDKGEAKATKKPYNYNPGRSPEDARFANVAMPGANLTEKLFVVKAYSNNTKLLKSIIAADRASIHSDDKKVKFLNKNGFDVVSNDDDKFALKVVNNKIIIRKFSSLEQTITYEIGNNFGADLRFFFNFNNAKVKAVEEYKALLDDEYIQKISSKLTVVSNILETEDANADTNDDAAKLILKSESTMINFLSKEDVKAEAEVDLSDVQREIDNLENIPFEDFEDFAADADINFDIDADYDVEYVDYNDVDYDVNADYDYDAADDEFADADADDDEGFV